MIGRTSSTLEMSPGPRFDSRGMQLSSSVTGARKMWFSRQPGKSTAKLYAISAASPRVTRHAITGRCVQMSDESFLEQVQRLVVDNAFAFVLGWLLGAGHVLSLFSDLAGAFS